MGNNLVKNFMTYWGKIHGAPIYAEELNPYELVIETEKGDLILYNDNDCTIRRLPNDSDNMTEEEFRREFKHTFRNILYERNMTQQELSEITGISEQTICNYANGKSIPGFYNMDKMAKALDCSIDDFRYTYKKHG